MTKKEYLEKRDAIATKIRAMADTLVKEERGFSAAEKEEHAKLVAAIDGLDEAWKVREAANQLDVAARAIAERAAAANGDPNAPAPAASAAAPKPRSSYRAFLEGGMAALSPEQRAAMVERMSSEMPPEIRAQSSQVGSSGGYTVEPEPLQAMERALKWYGGILDAATVITTGTGADLPFPTVNDTSNTGRRIAENALNVEKALAFGLITMKAYTYTSDIVLMPLQLLQDQAVDVESIINEEFGTRIGRIFNTEATTGTGQGQPMGIVTAASSGKTAASATAVTVNEMIDLEHSVDRAYRVQPGAGWMFNDSTLKAIKQLQDGSSRPIWLPGLSGLAGRIESDTLLNYPYFVNNDMAAMTTGNKTILFGALKKYIVRRVKGVTVLRLVERYADYFQVGFIAFARFDGQLKDAGAHPVKYLVQA